MNKESILLIFEEQILPIGDDTFIDSYPGDEYAVIFEDNQETGYFYAVDMKNNQKVLDALHIYNVADVIDKNKPSVIKILWTEEFNLAVLSINGYYHAVFDFKNRAGYCRNGFPAPRTSWTQVNNRVLIDELISQLAFL